MASYVITTVLLTILTMESINIYQPIYARSHANGKNIASQYRSVIAHHKTHQEHRSSRQNHQQHNYHQDSHHTPANDKSKSHEDLMEHMSHNHKRHNLRNEPNLWRHLQLVDSNGFGGHDVDFLPKSNENISAEDEKRLQRNLSSDKEYNDDHKNEENKYDEQFTVFNGAKLIPTFGTLRCPKCESNQRRVETVTEEELTYLRIEFVKQQILEKLRLKDKPNVSAVELPKPIYEGTTIQHDSDQTKTKDLDDYYARTNKKFIFLEREKIECNRLGTDPSICFSFKIDDADVDGFDVNTAVLWIFKNKLPTNSINRETILNQHIIVVSEVEQGLNPRYLPKVKPIAIQSVDVKDGWVKIDIEWPIKRWFGNHDLSHLIHISCESCEIDSMDGLISDDKDYRPFIMIDTQNRRRVSRQKRSINCTEGVTECCREKLYISFDEIGWGNWIIQPRGYDAYFCRGSCGSAASIAQSASHHSTFLQKVSTQRKSNGKKALELTPCCTAKQFSSLQLFFIDSNNTATLKTFPNMVIESCGCR